MGAEDRILARRQLDKRLNPLRDLPGLECPHRGWIKAIRESLGMTTAQLGKKMGVSQPRIVDIEKSEKTGAITFDTLERAAQAMDCKLVYSFVPRKPLNELIEGRARLIARERLKRTGHTMALEAQSVQEDDEQEQLDYLVRKIIEKAGSDLWKDD